MKPLYAVVIAALVTTISRLLLLWVATDMLLADGRLTADATTIVLIEGLTLALFGWLWYMLTHSRWPRV